MMLQFPSSIFFGTSTSACQIETAFQHDWQGMYSRDGHSFERTTDHEKHVAQDVALISSLAPHYRMSLMWSRLQLEPYGELDFDTVEDYHVLLTALRARNITIMLVLYHWANPLWFSKMGGWTNNRSASIFVDFAKRVLKEFGKYVSFWNTFNEPNLYTTFSYVLGEFPPFEKSLPKALTVIRNMGKAHDEIYYVLKSHSIHSKVGISINCVSFHHDNLMGLIPSAIARLWYMEFLQRYFVQSDFIGISYYARMSFDPFPVTYLKTPHKLTRTGRRHDKIWEYHPEGLDPIVRDYWRKFKKPIIITENGVCTDDDAFRIQSLKDYMTIIHRLLQSGVDILGYYHWSAWDNFEWTLGPTYRFGLYECDPKTMVRTKRPSADVYAELAYNHEIHL
jgi:beta-glucosidase